MGAKEGREEGGWQEEGSGERERMDRGREGERKERGRQRGREQMGELGHAKKKARVV